MDGVPPREFGKRRPVVVAPVTPPVKRSGHVALLLMGTFAVGGSAYALMPRENCTPTTPGMAVPQTGAACAPGSSYGSGHGGSWSSHASFFSGDSSSGRSSSGGSSNSGSTGVTRGGFGSFARAFSGHFSSGS